MHCILTEVILEAYLGSIKLLVPHDLVEVSIFAIELTEEGCWCTRSKIRNWDGRVVLGELQDDFFDIWNTVFSQSAKRTNPNLMKRSR